MQTALFSGELPSGKQSKLIVSGSEDNKVTLWDIDSMEVKARLEGHTDTVLAVDCNPDASRLQLASAGSDNTVKFWNYDSTAEQ